MALRPPRRTTGARSQSLAEDTFATDVRDADTNVLLNNPATVPPIVKGTAQYFYYSKHAERVYASQPGRVTIRWLTRNPEGTPSALRSKEETFAVSNTSLKPVRTIYLDGAQLRRPARAGAGQSHRHGEPHL